MSHLGLISLQTPENMFCFYSNDHLLLSVAYNFCNYLQCSAIIYIQLMDLTNEHLQQRKINLQLQCGLFASVHLALSPGTVHIQFLHVLPSSQLIESYFIEFCLQHDLLCSIILLYIGYCQLTAYSSVYLVCIPNVTTVYMY